MGKTWSKRHSTGERPAERIVTKHKSGRCGAAVNQFHEAGILGRHGPACLEHKLHFHRASTLSQSPMTRSLRQPVCFSGGVAVLGLVDLACWIDFARVPRAAKANNRSDPAVLTKEIPDATMVRLHALPPLLLLVTVLRDAATHGSALIPQQHFTMLV